MSSKRLTRISVTLIIVLALSGTTAPAAQISTAIGEIPVAGTVNGSYLDTQADDGVYEAIQEVEKPWS